MNRWEYQDSTLAWYWGLLERNTSPGSASSHPGSLNTQNMQIDSTSPLPAKISLCIDEGSGSEDDIQAEAGGEAEEGRQVELPGEAELAGPRLMPRPLHVGLDGVETGQPELGQPVSPERPRHSEVVNTAGRTETSLTGCRRSWRDTSRGGRPGMFESPACPTRTGGAGRSAGRCCYGSLW